MITYSNYSYNHDIFRVLPEDMRQAEVGSVDNSNYEEEQAENLHDHGGLYCKMLIIFRYRGVTKQTAQVHLEPKFKN